MIYKASYHNGIGNPMHNDRTCRQDKMQHVDHERTCLNFYWHNYIKKDSDMSFKEAEKKWYGSAFKEWINDINESAKRSRHPERRTSASKLANHQKYRPEETIIQIGDLEKFPDDPKLLQECFLELMKYRTSLVGRHCSMLNFAVHLDESTPHIHERHVWIYKDAEKGYIRAGQEEALKRAGLELPDPSQPVSQFNNRKVTYDRLMRNEWYNILERHGLEIDRTPNPEHKKHLSKQAYNEKIWEERERAAQEREEKKESSVGK